MTHSGHYTNRKIGRLGPFSSVQRLVMWGSVRGDLVPGGSGNADLDIEVLEPILIEKLHIVGATAKAKNFSMRGLNHEQHCATHSLNQRGRGDVRLASVEDVNLHHDGSRGEDLGVGEGFPDEEFSIAEGEEEHQAHHAEQDSVQHFGFARSGRKDG